MHQEREVEDKISRGYHQEKVRCQCDDLNISYADSSWKKIRWKRNDSTPPPLPEGDKLRLTKFM